MMDKKEERDLQKFLKNVDDIDSIIKELNDSDENTKNKALKKADNYLKQTCEQANCGFDKTVINKIQDEPSSGETRPEISPEEFMKQVEDDVEKRGIKKKQNKEKSLVWKDKGNKYFKDEKYADAVGCYSEAIKLTADEVTFYSNRAQALIKLEKYDAALEDCENGIKLDKNFVKIYVHQGRALIGLKRFEQAISSFNKVLKIDKKQEKVINEYLREVEKEKHLYIEEEKVSALLEKGDEKMHQIKSFVSSLRKGTPPDIWNGNNNIVNLKELITEEDNKTMFRTCGGFNIFVEHPAYRKLVRKEIFSQEDLNVVVNIIALLSNASEGCEENSNITSLMSHAVNAAVECLRTGNELRVQFEAIQFFHRISQFKSSRKNLLANNSISQLLDQALSLLGKGGDLALIAMAVINNLALDAGFVPQFKDKLSSDFIPGVIKMMEVLSLSFPDITLTKTFLPVMASSISTIANLFLNADLRKEKANDNDKSMWSVSHKLLTQYSTHLDDKSTLKVVHATLSMLMNLSTQKIIFEKEFSRKWVCLSVTLLHSSHANVVEYCCGILNHTLGCNEEMLKEIIDKKVYLDFINIIKGDNVSAQRYILKCLALCVSVHKEVSESIFSNKALSSLITLLDTEDEHVIGNTALIFDHCHENRSIIKEVTKCGVIKKLLVHARNDHISKAARHNCAVAIGKYSLAEPKCLQQLRDLHGLEILHEVMKVNKLV